MKPFKKYALTLSAIALLTGTSMGAAFADYKPNRENTGPTREQIEEMGFTGILPLDKIGMTIFQRHDTPRNELIFKMILPQQVEGCYETIPFEMEQKVDASILTIDMKVPILLMDAHKDCTHKREMEQGEVAINLDELREKDIKIMKLTSRYFTRSFEIELTDQKIVFKPTENVLLPELKYWFLPENAVALTVPMANEDIYYKHAMLQELAGVAADNGLIPVEDQIPEYMPHDPNPYNKFFFIDTRGDVLEMLKNGETSVTIGAVHTTEPFYGPEGKYDKKIPLDILATLPMATD